MVTRGRDAGSREVIIGEEAHIAGEKVGAARYSPLLQPERDAYKNRILVCPTDHTIVDKQEEAWTVDRMLRTKAEHERLMSSRSADPKTDGGNVVLPSDVMLEIVAGGTQLFSLVDAALGFSYVIDGDLDAAERELAETVVVTAFDIGEISSGFDLSERLDAERMLSEVWREAIAGGVVTYGARVDAEFRDGLGGVHWPTAVLRTRRAEQAARESRT